jgi:hypothetical protein
MALFGRETERDQQRVLEYGRWVSQRNPLAIASLVLGVFSLIELGALVVPGIASIALGIVSLVQLRRESQVRPRGHGLAIVGIALSLVSLIIAGFLYLPRLRG